VREVPCAPRLECCEVVPGAGVGGGFAQHAPVDVVAFVEKHLGGGAEVAFALEALFGLVFEVLEVTLQERGFGAEEFLCDFVGAVGEDEMEDLADGGHPEVIKDEHAADGEEVVGEEEIDQHGIEDVGAINEDDIVGFFFGNQAREGDLGRFFDKSEQIVEAGLLDVVEAEVLELGLEGVDGGVGTVLVVAEGLAEEECGEAEGGADFERAGGFDRADEVVEGFTFVALDGGGERGDGGAIGGGEGLVAVDGVDEGIHEGNYRMGKGVGVREVGVPV